MRLTRAALLVIAAVSLCGCNVSGSARAAPNTRTTGFWFWQGSSVDPAYSGRELDVLFVQAGTIRKETRPLYVFPPGSTAKEQWTAYGTLPSKLPPAREYWLVYRYEIQGVPDLQAASKVAAEARRLQEAARARLLNVVGLQLDVDSPTRALTRYAAFLREVRKGLPNGMQFSITALLDWFRSGTAVDDVIAQVDEFVPQFYDSDELTAGRMAIAARIDAARWGPVFNRFRKRFRIGISSFGRASMVPHEPPSPLLYRRLVFYGDIRPLDLATNPAFRLEASRSAADETVLTYRVIRNVELHYDRLEAGDTVQFIVSTPDSIRAAVESARRMDGYLAGVVFFRWPSYREDWTMQPDEVLEAAGGGAAGRGKGSRVEAVAGPCAAVHCVDVYLDSAAPMAPRPIRYRIRASAPLDYFLPEKNVPVQLAGASELEVSLPAYCSRGRLYLGRAVSLQPATFIVDEEQ